MTRLKWGTVGQRFYETGIDHGVLFLNDGTAVPWNGIIAVAESPAGGEISSYYHDGIKYMNLSTGEDFAASIAAFSAPEEFAACDGTAALGNGLFATQQPRQTFNLVYRTLVGNDVEGNEYGYKIHVVYNARSTPVQRVNASINGSPQPQQLQWGIDTVPMYISGRRATAHLIIDSNKTNEYLMTIIEDLLFGNEDQDPSLPDANDLVNMFVNYHTLTITDNGDGTWTATGPDAVVPDAIDGYFEITWPSAVPDDVNPDLYQVSSL